MIEPAVSFRSSISQKSVENVLYSTNAPDSVACVDARKGNFNTLEYIMAKHKCKTPRLVPLEANIFENFATYTSFII